MIGPIEFRRAYSAWSWVPLLAGLATAAFLCVRLVPLLLSDSTSAVSIVGVSLAACALVFCAGFVATRLTAAVTKPPSQFPRTLAALAVAAVGTWIAPYVLTSWDGAVSMAPVAGVLGLCLASLVMWYHRSLHVDDPAELEDFIPIWQGRELFGSVCGAKRSSTIGRALASAGLLQSGIAALSFGYAWSGAMAIAAGAAILGWTVQRGSQRGYGLHGSVRGSLLSAVGATALLCAIAVFGAPSIDPRAESEGIGGQDGRGRYSRARAEADLHSSVILRSDDLRKAVFLAPTPRRAARSLAVGPRNPLSFPFTGEYWFLPHRQVRPGSAAFILTGSPFEWVFSAVENETITMIAHQQMLRPVALDLVGSVDLTLRVADAERQTVTMETTLVRSREDARTERLRLGVQRLAPSGVASKAGHSAVNTVTLTFPIPEAGSMREFDELQVLFHLHSPRRYRSAKAEIDRFTLQPR